MQGMYGRWVGETYPLWGAWGYAPTCFWWLPDSPPPTSPHVYYIYVTLEIQGGGGGGGGGSRPPLFVTYETRLVALNPAGSVATLAHLH